MNGWTNKETWLVNLWYMDEMPAYFEDMEQYEVDANELRDVVEYVCLEGETMSNLPCGLVADFVNTCFSEVNWSELAEHLNAELAALDPEREED